MVCSCQTVSLLLLLCVCILDPLHPDCQ